MFVNNNLKIVTHTETQVGDKKRPDVDFIINNHEIHVDTTTINPAADTHITQQKKNVNLNGKRDSYHMYNKMPLPELNGVFDPTPIIEKRENLKMDKYNLLVKNLYGAESRIQAEFYPLVVTYDGIFGAHTELLFNRMRKLMNNGGGYNMNSTYLKSLLQNDLFTTIYRLRHSN